MRGKDLGGRSGGGGRVTEFPGGREVETGDCTEEGGYREVEVWGKGMEMAGVGRGGEGKLKLEIVQKKEDIER